MSLLLLPISFLIIISFIPNYYNTEIQTYKYFYATSNYNNSIVLLTSGEIHFLVYFNHLVQNNSQKKMQKMFI